MEAAFPRARGWTDRVNTILKARRGFSACARVDRRAAPGCRPRSRLFRVRAAGPATVGPNSRVLTAFPRARGWTGAAGPRRRQGVGFSACARVDRRRSSSAATRRRLIRVRAGGPCIMQLVQDLTGAYPRARGWTAVEAHHAVLQAGFSACARMDRSCRSRRASTAWLFRVRAGGPNSARLMCPFSAAFPRARGWTEDDGALPSLRLVFSACARLDRRGSCRAGPGGRLFRVRAGGPWRQALTLFEREAFPRARGWTRPRIAMRGRDHGFSACARVDPRKSWSTTPRRWLFRVRAGGPVTYPGSVSS